ncbi:MAG: hypothetical protein ABJB97_02475 [Acidobacteriota bacterium]
MKALTMRWGLIALVSLVAIVILSIGNRTGAVPDQTREVREAANEVGTVVQGGITHGQVFRFGVAHLIAPASQGHPGGVNLELNVFDSQGNVVATHQFHFPPAGANQGNNTWRHMSFDLDGNQLGANTYDTAGRAQLIGVIRHLPGSNEAGGIPGGGCVVAGEIFNSDNVNGVNGRTVVYIPGITITRSRDD